MNLHVPDADHEGSALRLPEIQPRMLCRTKRSPAKRITNIKQDFWIRGELVVVEDVPAGVCPQCGEKVVKVGVGFRLAQPNLLSCSGFTVQGLGFRVKGCEL